MILSFSSITLAKQIRIQGTPDLNIQVKNSSVLVQGNYTLVNSGDELATNVYPRISLDLFKTVGKAVDLHPGQKHVWSFNHEIPRKQLCLEKSQNCDVALPLAGQFLIHFENNYADANAYTFSIPQLGVVNTKNATQDRLPQMQLALKIKKIAENIYQADYEAHNQLTVDVDLKIEPVLPKEVELLTTVSPLLLKEKASLFGSFQFRNVKGLQGSRYYAYMTAQWQNAGERKVAMVFAPFAIGQQIQIFNENQPPNKVLSIFNRYSKAQIFWSFWSAIAVVGFIILIIFWILPLRKMR